MAEKKINGRTFKVERLLATQALAMWHRLIKVAGPAWENFRAKLATAGTMTEIDQMGVAIQAMVDVVSNSTSEEAVELIRDIVQQAMIKRPSGSYEVCDLDGDFTDHLADIMEVATFVLMENFSDFLPGKGRSGPLQRPKAA